MAKISLNVDEPTLQAFDILWKTEGWESRQEAIVFNEAGGRKKLHFKRKSRSNKSCERW